MSRARVRKTLDRLAYASLVLDICIAVITTLSILGQSRAKVLLIPINYLLTIVVVLSVAMFAVLLLLRTKERQIVERKGQLSSSPSDVRHSESALGICPCLLL